MHRLRPITHRVLLWGIVAGLLAVIVGLPGDARAQGSMGAPRGKVEWKTGQWDRFTLWEGAFTAGVTVAGYVLSETLEDPIEPRLDF